MPCEMCGKEYRGCKPAIIDGVKMMLCPECIKYGTEIQTSSAPTRPVGSNKQPLRTNPQRDVFKKMEKELVNDWSKKIQQAREKKGLTRERLGFKIGERTVTISKLENGDLRPSDKIVEKLEKELGIKLTEDVLKPVSPQSGRAQSQGLTLGDFIKTDK